MAADGKASNKAEELKGKVKEGVGGAVGDENLERQGRNDQAKSNLKQGVEKIKDAFKS